MNNNGIIKIVLPLLNIFKNNKFIYFISSVIYFYSSIQLFLHMNMD